MTNLRLFEPSNLKLFEPSLGDPFESMFKRFLTPTWFDRDVSPLEMRVDVTEKNGIYTIRADIPGVKKEDISISIDGNVVQIDAEVRHEQDTKENGKKILRSERYYGSISRSFTVSQDVDDSQAKATYEDGVLTLELPKKATVTSKQITIQ
jgi:HSP20 family protein